MSKIIISCVVAMLFIGLLLLFDITGIKLLFMGLGFGAVMLCVLELLEKWQEDHGKNEADRKKLKQQ